jgi:RNA polymerase sigma-70 factor (ECF subfamily)
MDKASNALSLEAGDAPVEELASRRKLGAGTVVGLFQKHANRVRRSLAFRLRNPEDAQDATQEAFLKVWRKEREGNLREEASAYLYSAANSVATDFERWRTFHVIDRRSEVELEDVPATAAGTEERQHWRDAMALFVESVDNLPELTRNVFLLHHVKGLTYPQIAKQLDVSTRTVERHIAQALTSLERKLKEFL